MQYYSTNINDGPCSYLTNQSSIVQEHLSDNEVEAAIHTDSRHADRLRAMYSDKQTAELGHLVYKRIDFMGSRRSFEILKRISGDNMGNVYGLVIRA